MAKLSPSGMAHLRAAALGTTALIGGFMFLVSAPAAQAACTVASGRLVNDLVSGDTVTCIGTFTDSELGGGDPIPTDVTMTIGDGTTPTSVVAPPNGAVILFDRSSVSVLAGATLSMTSAAASSPRLVEIYGNDSTVTIAGGTLELHGAPNSQAVKVNGLRNTVDLQSGEITASGNNAAFFNFLTGQNTVTISGGSIVGTGTGSTGVGLRNGNNTLTMSGGSISTATQAIVFHSGSNDAATISGGDISTTESGNAVEVVGTGSTLKISGGSITTTAGSANAVVAQAAQISDGSIKTSGDSSAGVSINANAGTLLMSGGSIKTTGANAHGINARGNDASLTINNGSVSATGSGANAIGISSETGTSTLTIGAAASITGNISGVRDTVPGADAVFELTLNGTGASVIDGAISGFETIAKNDSGSFKLNGVITGTNTININAGLLSLNTDFSGAINIASGGRLGGSGSLGALTVGTGSTLAPGNSIGRLNVTSADFASGSTFDVEVNDGGNVAGVNNDQLHATGTVNISSGAGVTVKPVNGTDNGTTYAASTVYKIISSDTLVKGTFGTVTDSFAFLDASLAYTTNSVDLTLSRNDTAFVAVGTTPNQIGVAGTVTELDSGNVVNAVTGLSEKEARDAFNQLSGEAQASFLGGLISSTGALRSVAGQRIQSAFDAGNASGGDLPSFVEGLAYWSQGYGGVSKSDGDGNAGGMKQDTGGVLVGADAVSGDWMLGLMAGYSRTSARVDDRNSSSDINSYHAGLYGSREFGALKLRSGLIYSWNDIATNRSVVFGGLNNQLSASYDAGALQAFGEIGYGIETEMALFEPFANLVHVNLATDGFTETGGSAALTSAKASSDVTFTTLGVRVNRAVNLGGTSATLKGMLGWEHGLGDTTPQSTLAFAGGKGFTISGTPIASDAAVFDAGFDVALSETATLGLSYNGQLSRDTSRHGVDGKFNVRF